MAEPATEHVGREEEHGADNVEHVVVVEADGAALEGYLVGDPEENSRQQRRHGHVAG